MKLPRFPFVALLAAGVAVAVLSIRLSPGHAAFPGTNGKIAFTVIPTTAPLYIATVNPDGTGIAQLSGPASGPEWMPAWSPDGQKIVFAKQPQPGDSDEIYTMNRDGTGVTRLTYDTATSEEPNWSPNGQKIVFQSECDIFTMKADGTRQVNITDNGGCESLRTQDSHPTWSPDGERILFETYRTGDLEIFTMNADGTEPIDLSNSAGADYDGDWSPDGTRIAFRSDRDGGPAPGEIYLMDANGSHQTNITNNLAAYDLSPAWSPDGTKIAFIRSGPWDIYVMNADGTGVTSLGVDDSLGGTPGGWHYVYTGSIDWQPLPHCGRRQHRIVGTSFRATGWQEQPATGDGYVREHGEWPCLNRHRSR